MTWETYHRRQAAIEQATATADRRLDGALPWDLAEVRAAFDTPTELLLALHLRWHTRLAGAVERASDPSLADPAADLEAAVVHAWRETAAAMPGVRRVLDRHDDDSALARARAKQAGFLASAAGRAALGDPGAVRAGEAVRERAQGIRLDRRRPRVRHSGWPSRGCPILGRARRQVA